VLLLCPIMSSSVQTAGATTLSPSLLAGALVFASRHLEALGLPHPTHAQILATTGAGSTRAYARAQEIEAELRTLDRPVGRPRKAAAPPPAPSSREELQARLLAFLLEHPGCVVKKQQRRSYSDALRRFLVALYEEYQAHLSFEEFARVAQIPEKTLRAWLRLREDTGTEHVDDAGRDCGQSDGNVHERIHVTELERLVAAWDIWTGSFEAFFRYARRELGITAGKDYVRNVLEALRARPVHRRGTAPDQTALRQSFETFFPGAQWVGDGTELTFTLNGEPFTFHLELFVDADSAALAGAAVRDEEDSVAVIDAFRDGAATTGFPPIAALLDNRPSNHTSDVHAALDHTLPIRATRGRAQNKGHVEGSFGLFSQTAPLLSLHASTSRALAAGIIELVVTTWARTLNHKPRPSRGGLSRVQLYQQSAPTPEQIALARARLTALQHKQQLAYETRTRRLDPVACQLIDDAFARLSISDPTGNLRRAIAGYPRTAILDGIATFTAKMHAGTLPPELQPALAGRYLLGIVRNLADRDFLLDLAEELLRLRIRARDLELEHLRRDLQQQLHLPNASPDQRLSLVLDRVLASSYQLPRLFWLRAAADLIRAQPLHLHRPLLAHATCHLATSFLLPRSLRADLIRLLARSVLPVA
jgi:transposase-like protein